MPLQCTQETIILNFLEIIMGCFNVTGTSGTASNYVAREHSVEASPTHTPQQTGRRRAPGTPPSRASNTDAAEMRALRNQAQALQQRAIQELPNPRTDAASTLLDSLLTLVTSINRMDPSTAQNRLAQLEGRVNSFYTTNPVGHDQLDQSDRFSDTASHASDIYHPSDSFRFMSYRPGR
ncbi:hypothetical protein V4889_24125 [Ralstonia solanacearum species complex bacterium KE101]|nr:hypothetical protein [Ralstonia pseudosolanacearum]QKL58811.1 hypothetical protein HI814_19080 [Ralstonia solanacearum]MCK4129514.1 hypothetical protein [Ralstonia pseudosolanacearum]MCK4135480.1 hypothetical protein [Ralstonia pseudosolanacearum]MCK4143608.1 hypothetical protein [Ralstonia pseudosolanacearum]MCQ4677925.1 hypothetical protein [Ralstonia pseudosolanacearum]